MAERDESGRFVAGSSGNPGGRPKIVSEVRELAQKNSPKAMQKLVDLLDDDDPKIVIAAAKEILDRALGKATQGLELEGGEGVTFQIVVNGDEFDPDAAH